MVGQKLVALDRGFDIVLKDLGMRPEDVLRRAGLPVGLFEDDEARLTVDEYFCLWLAIEAEAADPELPIRIATASTVETFHPALFAALCSSNLEVAMQRISKYKRLKAPVMVSVERGDGELVIGKQWCSSTTLIPPILSSVELVFSVQIARLGTRYRVCPVKVESPYAMEPRQAYEAYFGVSPVKSGRHSVTFSAMDAERPFLTARESIWEIFEPELRRRLADLEASASLQERTHAALLEGLPSGEFSIEAVARQLGLSARSLQRGLRRDALTYKEVIRRTREQLAFHYLKNTTLAYAEIGFLLGYGEPSSFFRAFRRWTGKTPETFRLAAHRDNRVTPNQTKQTP